MALLRIASAEGNNSLARRILSAAIGIPVLILAVWAGSFLFAFLVAAAALIGSLEFYNLTGVRRLWLQRIPGLGLTGLLVANGYQQMFWSAPLVAAGLLLLLMSYVWTPLDARPWLRTLAAPLYLGATLSYAVLLRDLDHGVQWVILALMSTFSVDTSAYIFGRAVGRHRMVVRLSPAKTWEGAVAGLAGGVGTTLLLNAVLGLSLEPWVTIVLGFGIGVVAQVGDLLESALKRAAKAKESGWLIPGHGGIMDRLDSVVFTLVLVYYAAIWGRT